ncbi:MerR family transcriptional regulator [Marivibrio halodurans]|uniref:MerR family transcriptional regulator n=1 Tax=Marivibrio halodurans TaxID=2039722 RepID=A0A8J7UZK5_9PROT|nr:MerR family transcriptional regulator [Marivibrio halodurans]MBP5855781.1 MerR family transcriptional regulator [Marivibrio halodurans]
MTAADGDDGRAKAANAFRTISEVADDLDVPQHVLRFWETKFAQVKPMKRAGGRRYYRPDDVVLLQRIRDLLYSEGFTIRGVQKVLRERGVRALIDGEPAQNGNGECDGAAASVNSALETVTESQPSFLIDPAPGTVTRISEKPAESTGGEGRAPMPEQTVDPAARDAACAAPENVTGAAGLTDGARSRLEAARRRLVALRATLAE